MSALLIMHMQNDFIEGGSINIPYSLSLIPIINRLKEKFKYCFFVKDLHPQDHASFIKNGGTLRQHCVNGTEGAELHKWIKISDSDYVINKGTLTLYDSSSAFYNAKEINKETLLDTILRKNNITNLFMCGVAIENEIFSTTLDAMRQRYHVTIITDASAGLDKKKVEKTLEYCKSMGIQTVNSKDVSKADI
jgi:nicotinamidase/pyrazinamidase